MNCEEVDHRGLVELYVADRLAEPDREAFEAHYFDCDRCFEAVETAARIRGGFAQEPGVARPRGRTDRGREPARWGGRRLAPVAIGLAAAAVVAALFVVVLDDGAVGDSLAPLGAVTESDLPPYVNTRLRADSFGDGRTDFESGMDAYGRHEWGRAAERLGAAVEADPTRALWRFYLGAALLADGRAGDAVPHLQAATTDERFGEEATWLLAKARLQRGEVEPAREALERLVGSAGERAGDARALLERIDQAMESR